MEYIDLTKSTDTDVTPHERGMSDEQREERVKAIDGARKYLGDSWVWGAFDQWIEAGVNTFLKGSPPGEERAYATALIECAMGPDIEDANSWIRKALVNQWGLDWCARHMGKGVRAAGDSSRQAKDDAYRAEQAIASSKRAMDDRAFDAWKAHHGEVPETSEQAVDWYLHQRRVTGESRAAEEGSQERASHLAFATALFRRKLKRDPDAEEELKAWFNAQPLEDRQFPAAHLQPTPGVVYDYGQPRDVLAAQRESMQTAWERERA